jgi:hypothetical protein
MEKVNLLHFNGPSHPGLGVVIWKRLEIVLTTFGGKTWVLRANVVQLCGRRVEMKVHRSSEVPGEK